MVTITKNGKSLTVTAGAFKGIYKALGYAIAEEDLTVLPVVETPVVEPVEGEEGVEKPLSEMSFKELKAYAIELGVNTNGMTRRKELRQAIREHLAE